MSTAPARTWPVIRIILLILAVVCFILATAHAPVGPIDLTNLGLALGFAAWLPWFG